MLLLSVEHPTPRSRPHCSTRRLCAHSHFPLALVAPVSPDRWWVAARLQRPRALIRSAHIANAVCRKDRHCWPLWLRLGERRRRLLVRVVEHPTEAALQFAHEAILRWRSIRTVCRGVCIN